MAFAMIMFFIYTLFNLLKLENGVVTAQIEHSIYKIVENKNEVMNENHSEHMSITLLIFTVKIYIQFVKKIKWWMTFGFT